MDTSLHQYFMDTECANNSVSYDVAVCNEGEVCMAMVFDVKGRVHFWGTGRHCTYHNCTLRLPLCITVFTVFFCSASAGLHTNIQNILNMFYVI